MFQRGHSPLVANVGGTTLEPADTVRATGTLFTPGGHTWGVNKLNGIWQSRSTPSCRHREADESTSARHDTTVAAGVQKNQKIKSLPPTLASQVRAPTTAAVHPSARPLHTNTHATVHAQQRAHTDPPPPTSSRCVSI